MVSGGRPRRIFWGEETRGCLWGPAVLQHLPGDDQVEQLDGQIAVITTDASGWAGGAWWGQRRLHYAFTDAQLAGLYGGSANLRELYVPPFTVEKWQTRGVRILFRMDSAASVGAINRRGSMVPHFNALVLQLMELLEALGSEAVARPLPGKENVLSDGISRLSGRPDPSDWMLSPAVFHALRNLYGPFEVDACCDALGNNSLCSVFWSALDSALTRSWAGKVVWCHPPVGEAEAFWQHFWQSSCEAPESTSAVFLLPVWPTAGWWRFVGGGRVAAYYPAGARLFSRPDWSTASRRHPLPTTRISGVSTNWAVVAVFFAPALSGLPWYSALPRLRGVDAPDLLFLRGMPSGVVPVVRRPTTSCSS